MQVSKHIKQKKCIPPQTALLQTLFIRKFHLHNMSSLLFYLILAWHRFSLHNWKHSAFAPLSFCGVYASILYNFKLPHPFKVKHNNLTKVAFLQSICHSNPYNSCKTTTTTAVIDDDNNFSNKWGAKEVDEEGDCNVADYNNDEQNIMNEHTFNSSSMNMRLLSFTKLRKIIGQGEEIISQHNSVIMQ